MSFTISNESDRDDKQYRVMVEHPNGGVSEVVIALMKDGRLEVDINPSRTNGTCAYYADMPILDLEPAPTTDANE